MFNNSVQAQFLVPMATSLAFGVLFSTFVTLFVVPSGYMMLEDIKAFTARLTGAQMPSRQKTIAILNQPPSDITKVDV